jgi:flagellar hook-associated protein FlgK
MTDLIAVGGAAIRNSQLALSVVSNNIANANTEGYVRQDLDVSENTPTKNGLFYLGSGALAEGVRRSYDGQVEASLRASSSDLRAQTPLIEHTQRMINVLGNESASLTPALGSFFDSLKTLSVDASSDQLRTQALTEAEILASRFNALATQLESLDTETQQLATAAANEFNALAGQLANVNVGLQKTNDIQKQPAALLDTRDKLLRDMSAIAKISVRETISGTVAVTVGDGSSNTSVVDGGKSTPIQVRFLATDNGRAEVLLDPFGEPVNLSGLLGGELGGMINFRDQMLAPAIANLDNIAKVLMQEMNATHAKGMDMNEKPGKALFVSPPDFTVDYSNAKGSASPSISLVTESAANLRPMELLFDAAGKRWIATDLNSGTKYASTGNPPSLGVNGLAITINGVAQDGDQIAFSGKQNWAKTISLAITDSKDLAAGDLFRVSKNVANLTDVDATIGIVNPAAIASTVPELSTLLVNNVNNAAALAVDASYSLAKSFVAAGTKDIDLTFSKSVASTAELQIFTRDGRHLFGSGLTAAQQSVMLSAQNGFMTDSTYSNAYLNGDTSYMGQSWTIGATGRSVSQAQDDGSKLIVSEALIRSSTVSTYTNNTLASVDVIANGALKLDGNSLGALSVAAGQSLNAAGVKTWLDGQISANSLALTVTTENIIRVPANELSSTTGLLTINSVSINGSTPIFTKTADLVNAINIKTAATNVEARQDFDGALILKHLNGGTISFGSTAGVLTRMTGDVAPGFVIQANRAASDTSAKTVALTLSSTGSTTDLAKLGLDTTVNIAGQLKEDLIVFSTGTTGNSAKLSAGYTKGVVDPLQLRSNTLDIEFVSDSEYKITDKTSNTIVAQRSYTAGQVIQYQNLQVTLSGSPKSGDKFQIDNNQKGFGSNENIVRLSNLESAKLLGNDETFHESYLNLINLAGSTARQATVTKEALQVVYDQAFESRDQIAGVNLDEEAANLIRFQQAYQASARLVQTANELFDTIVRL